MWRVTCSRTARAPSRFVPCSRASGRRWRSVSIAELFKWTLKRGWGPEKVEQLEAALRRYVVIPYDRDLAWAWARVVAVCEDAGRPIAPSDAWIAATALRHDVPLLTNNLKHYEAAETLCGLQLLRAQST
ncbi:MAG: PIN domain-containing protein [Isosphaeraceae bacterium]